MISYEVAEFGAPLQRRERATSVPQGSEVLVRTLAAGCATAIFTFGRAGTTSGKAAG